MNWKNFWTAHIATQNPTKGKKNGKNAWFYGKSSHLKKNYWKRKDIHSEKKGSDHNENSNEDNQVEVMISSKLMMDEVLVVGYNKYYQDWMLDTSATIHMSFQVIVCHI